MTLSYTSSVLRKFGPSSGEGFNLTDTEDGTGISVRAFLLTDTFNNGFYTEEILPRVTNGGGVKGVLKTINQGYKAGIEFGLIPTHYLEHILQNVNNGIDINPFKYGFVRLTDNKMEFGLKKSAQRIDISDTDEFEFKIADNKINLYINDEFKYLFDKKIEDDLTFFCLLKHTNPEVFPEEALVIFGMEIKTI